MIESIKENIEKKKILELIEHFNEKAKELNLKFVLKFRDDNLISAILIDLNKNIIIRTFSDSYEIFYNQSRELFYFSDRINKQTFKNIQEILNAVPEKFEVDLKEMEK